MQKFSFIAGLITLAVIVSGVFLFSRPQNATPSPAPDTNAYLYFWGDGCPHCKVVDDFLETWEGKDKINLQKFEVWYNKGNAALMAEKAKACDIQLSDMGVPFMVTPDGKCLSGDTPIIDFFKSLK